MSEYGEPAQAESVSGEESPELLEAISSHPSVLDGDRLGGRRAIRRLYGLPSTSYSSRECNRNGSVKGSRRSWLH